MNDLFRELAPIPEAGWAEIESQARRTLKTMLAARKVVDFKGPLGWQTGAIEVGRVERLSEAPGPGVTGALRQVQPLVEFRVPFALSRRAIEAISRGAADAELDPVTEAARTIAVAEDHAVFHGYPAGRITGIFEASAAGRLSLTDDYVKYPAVVAEATAALRLAGVDGPYAIVLGPRCFTGLVKTTTSAGYPVMEHVKRLVDRHVLWAKGLDGAVVLSLRGGDFELAVGRDFAIGYQRHDADSVELYLEESFTFRILAAEAAVPLAYSA